MDNLRLIDENYTLRRRHLSLPPPAPPRGHATSSRRGRLLCLPEQPTPCPTQRADDLPQPLRRRVAIESAPTLGDTTTSKTIEAPSGAVGGAPYGACLLSLLSIALQPTEHASTTYGAMTCKEKSLHQPLTSYLLPLTYYLLPLTYNL